MRRLGLGFKWGAGGGAIPTVAFLMLSGVAAAVTTQSPEPLGLATVLAVLGAIVSAIVGGVVGMLTASVLGVLRVDRLAPMVTGLILAAPAVAYAGWAEPALTSTGVAIVLPVTVGLGWFGWWIGSQYLAEVHASRP